VPFVGRKRALRRKENGRRIAPPVCDPPQVSRRLEQGADYLFDARLLPRFAPLRADFFALFFADFFEPRFAPLRAVFFALFLADFLAPRFAPLRAVFFAPFLADFFAPRFVAFLAVRFFAAFLADFFAPVFLALRFFADLRVFFAGGEELGAIIDIMSAIIV
jgi:hypothetical protein